MRAASGEMRPTCKDPTRSMATQPRSPDPLGPLTPSVLQKPRRVNVILFNQEKQKAIITKTMI